MSFAAVGGGTLGLLAAAAMAATPLVPPVAVAAALLSSFSGTAVGAGLVKAISANAHLKLNNHRIDDLTSK